MAKRKKCRRQVRAAILDSRFDDLAQVADGVVFHLKPSQASIRLAAVRCAACGRCGAFIRELQALARRLAAVGHPADPALTCPKRGRFGHGRDDAFCISVRKGRFASHFPVQLAS